MSNGLQVFLAALRVAAGLSLIGPGLQKLGWFTHPALEQVLAGWTAHTTNPLVLRYLHAVIPHANVLARIVVLGELTLGALLVLGLLTPIAAVAALVMVLNFHFASGVMLHAKYLLGQDGLVYVLVFPLLAAGRAGLAFGADGAIGRGLRGAR